VSRKPKLGVLSEAIRLAGGSQNRFERGDDRSVELTLHGLGETETCDPTRHRIPVRTVRSHGVVCIRHGDDLGKKRDFCGAEAVGIPGAVYPFVVMSNDRSDLGIGLDVGKDSFADYGMVFHMSPLFKSERPGLF
jgi:hypothetical protein